MEHDISVKEQSVASPPFVVQLRSTRADGVSSAVLSPSHMAPKLEGTIRDFQLHVSDGFLCVWVLLHQPIP